jgi:galactosamine-6-phosphate isomerase
MPHLHVAPDHESASRLAADWLAAASRRKPTSLVTLASGSTPTRAYELFVEQCQGAPQLSASLRVLKLDEWGGLPGTCVGSCEEHLRRVFVDPLRLSERYVSFDGATHDPSAECQRVANWLATKGPIDACLLGLGINGHLGFNEPADELQPHAHVAELSAASLSHAMIRDTPTRPACGLTLGVADLMQSRGLLVIATGAAKREPLRRMLLGAISPRFPASIIQLHQNAVVVCDQAANPRLDRVQTAIE